ncbi:hypothetical protein [Euzebya tangerina]|uniref:hypothetical protein n=1 Tax=Euzebya tangerina TaxID=591198 RepID=UPI000E3238D9|nr:hypothetical protein [Euzebya tangerina]
MAVTGARRRLIAVLAIAAVGVLVVVAARSADRATVTDVLPIPDVGSIRADRLANGTPVFVISTPALGDTPPTLDVIQAFTPEVEGPITGLVAWCSASSQFVDPHHGVVYDHRGRRVPSSLAGREDPSVTFADHTALDDLIHRRMTLAEGREAPGDPIVVGGIQPLQPWQVEQRPFMQPALPPRSCRLPDRPLPLGELAEASTGDDGVVADGQAFADQLRGTRTVDHSFLAGPLEGDRTGWQITDGWVVVGPDGTVRWCPDDPTACDDAAGTPEVAFGFEPDDVGRSGAALGDPLAVRLDTDGRVARVAVMADSTWRGSSLRGIETVRGVLANVPSQGRPVVGVAELDTVGPSRCADRAPRVPTAPAVEDAAPLGFSVSADTLIAVGDASTALDLSRLDLTEAPREVEVELDAVTCTALAITAL